MFSNSLKNILVILVGILLFSGTILYSVLFNSKKKVLVNSSPPGFEISISNEKRLFDYLKSWKILSPESTVSLEGITSKKNVIQLWLDFTDIPQKFGDVGDDTEQKTSSVSSFNAIMSETNKNRVNIKVYIDTEHLYSFPEKEKNARLSVYTLQAIYLVFHPPEYYQNDEILKELKEIYENTIKSDDPIFVINKK